MAASKSRSASNGRRKSSVQKGRSPLERVIIWSGIGALLFIAAFEGSSRYFCDNSLRKLEAATREQQNGQEMGIPVAEVGQMIQGFCFRKIEGQDQAQGGEVPNGGAGRPRTLLFRWPSLFRTLQLGVRVTEADRAISVMGDYVEDPAAKFPTSPVPATPAVEPLPAKGLSQAADDVLVLATNELKVTNGMRKRRLGSLIRELLRQSFLISARDELKLFTLDESLGEIPFVTTSPSAYPFQINVSLDDVVNGSFPLTVTVSRVQPDGKKWTWTSKPVPLPESAGLSHGNRI